MDIRDGEDPAFPLEVHCPTTGSKFYYGMTLRDYFAAMAMQELVRDGTPASAAKDAYEYADAMLKSRIKED